MANPVKGQVPLKLDGGREFILVFDMEALIQAEGEYGKPLPALIDRVQQGFFGAIRVLFWAAMQRHHPEVSLVEAGEMISQNPEAIEKMLAAYTKAMPDAEGKESGNPRGKPSGANGAKRASTRKVSGKSPRARSR